MLWLRRGKSLGALRTRVGFVAAVCLAALLSPARLGAQIAGPAGFSLDWTRSVEPLVAIALSPQGQNLGMIARSGKLALWDAATGTSIWSVPHIAEHNLAVSDQMGYALVYDQMNRIDRTVTLFRASTSEDADRSQGDAAPAPQAAAAASHLPVIAMRRTLDGAAWCSGVSLDGSLAAIGTGSREICLFSLQPSPKMSVHPIDGICNDLSFAPNGRYVAIGLWNQSGVEAMTPNGRIKWSYFAANDRRYDVSVAPDSQNVLAISFLNPRWSDPLISLLGSEGSVHWSYALGANTYGPAATLGRDSQISFASYTETVRRGRQIVPERSLIALGPQGGAPLWTRRGGVFVSFSLLCLSPSGRGVVAYDGNKTLYLLNSDGQVTARDKLSSTLQYWAVSHDHTHLLLYTGDSELTMLTIH